MRDLDKLTIETETIKFDGKTYEIPTNELGLHTNVGPFIRRLREDRGLTFDSSFLRDFIAAGTDIPKDVVGKMKIAHLNVILDIIYPKKTEAEKVEEMFKKTSVLAQADAELKKAAFHNAQEPETDPYKTGVESQPSTGIDSQENTPTS